MSLNLCESCRGLDYRWLRDNACLERDELEHNASLDDGSDNDDSDQSYPSHRRWQRTAHCAICTVLPIIKQASGDDVDRYESLVLQPYSFPDISEWSFPGASRTVRLCLAREGGVPFRPALELDQILFEPYDTLDDDGGLMRPRPLEATPDYEIARAWLNNCRDHHAETCCKGPAIRAENLRLIDCETVGIVNADSLTVPFHYLALSYVWGNESHLAERQRESNTCPIEEMPQTVRDAMTVTRELGYRYLWVDEYCIDQQNSAHKLSQIMQMDRIYSGADLTIVDAAGHHKHFGLPGVSSTPRVHTPAVFLDEGAVFSIGPDPRLAIISTSPWSQRAWTLQEGLLSERLLVFTEHQMSFYCQKTAWMEALRGPQDMSHLVPEWNSWPICIRAWEGIRFNDLSQPPLVEFRQLLLTYTNRKLSHQSDALNAITGMLSRLQQSEKPVLSLCGLPFSQHAHDETPQSVEQALAYALSWSILSPKPPERRDDFPSWTWAGWIGPAKLFWRDQQSCLTNARLETSDPFSTMPDSRETASLQCFLDSVIALNFEAPLVPAEVFSTRNHPSESREFFGANTCTCRPADENIDHAQHSTEPWPEVIEDQIIPFCWCRLQVADSRLSPQMCQPPQEFLGQLLYRLRRGVWWCLLVAQYRWPFNEQEGEVSGRIERFVLVVELEDERTARRVGWLNLCFSPDLDTCDDTFWSRLAMRSVRLL